MNLKTRIYYSLAKIFPKNYVRYLQTMIKCSGYKYSAVYHLGSSLLLSILVSVAVAVGLYFFTTYHWLLITLASISIFAIIQILFYAQLYLSVENRSEEVEKHLPDQLQLMANNLKSGMTPYNALKLSAREEFGPLFHAINQAINEAAGTASFSDILIKMKSNIKSIVFERVVKLEAASVRTGGNLPRLLNDLAEDIRDTQALRSDLISKTKTYSAFILFTVLFGTPTLLAISLHFVEMISGFTQMTAAVSSSAADIDLGVLGGGNTIEPVFLLKLSFVILTLTALLASSLMGVIHRGKARSGLRFVGPLILGVFLIFFLARHIIGTFFGSMT